MGPTLSFSATHREALDGLVEEWERDFEKAHLTIKQKVSRPKPGVVEVNFRLEGEGAQVSFWYLLLFVLGHGIDG